MNDVLCSLSSLSYVNKINGKCIINELILSNFVSFIWFITLTIILYMCETYI